MPTAIASVVAPSISRPVPESWQPHLPRIVELLRRWERANHERCESNKLQLHKEFDHLRHELLKEVRAADGLKAR